MRDTLVHWNLLLLGIVAIPSLIEPGLLLVDLWMDLTHLLLKLRSKIGIGMIVDDVGRRALTDPLCGTVAGRIGSERFQVQNLGFVFDKIGSNRTALPSLLGVQGQHAGHCLIEKVTVFLLECSKQRVQFILLQLIRTLPVYRIAVLERPARQDCETNAKNLSETRVHMRRIRPLLHEIVIDLLGSEIDDSWFVLRLEKSIIVVLFARKRASADDLDLSTLIDEDIGGVDVTDLSLEVLELLPRPHDVVQKIPDLSFQEVLLQLRTILYLRLKHELVIVEAQLPQREHTRTSPPDPQRPTGSKACLIGRKRTSLVYESSICSMARTHTRYNFSD